MKFKFFSIFIIIIITRGGFAQQFECGTEIIHNYLMQTDTAYMNHYLAFAEKMKKAIHYSANVKMLSSVYNIPVVVHVIHLGEAVGTGSNISDSQIMSAINGLNDRFRNIIGAGADIEINFCLSSRDPAGNTSSGIVRVNGSGIANYSTDGINLNGGCGADEITIKDLSKWPVSEYYNIWVVQNICGNIAGYASYPSGGPYDGTVIDRNYMTYSSTTLTHEIGHGFDLMHTFQGDGNDTYCPVDTSCTINGDKICDTPPHKVSDCGSSNPCSGSGTWDNSRYNYMSYCSSRDRFTQGQKDQMRTAASIAPRVSLLASLGCLPVTADDASVSNIIFPSVICTSSFAPTVEIKNFGTNALQSVIINYKLDSGPVNTFSWTGNLSSNSFIYSAIPSISYSAGFHTLVAFTSEPNGIAGPDGYVYNDTSIISFEFKNITPTAVAAITASGPTTNCNGNLTLTAATADNYSWSSGDSAQAIDVFGTGNYSLTVSDANGCISYDSIDIVNNLGDWTQMADMGASFGRMGSVGFAIGSKGYIGTGKIVNTRLKDFWEYNPATNSWTQKADFSGSARYGAVGFCIGQKGYLGTGNDGNYLKDFWEYDTTNNIWTQKTDLGGSERMYAVGFSIGNKGYIGTGRKYSYFNDFWEYDPANDIWTAKTNVPSWARIDAVGFSIGNKGYIGTGTESTSYNYTKDFWEYDPDSNAWTPKSPIGGYSADTKRSAAVGFSIGTKGYIGTGFNNSSGYRKDFWEWDQTTDSWREVADFTGSARVRAVGFAIGSFGYIGTGFVASAEKDLWKYTPPKQIILNTTQTNVNCNGGNNGSINAAISGSINPYSYSWSSGQTSSTISGLTAGIYTFTVTDGYGCTSVSSVNITAPSPLSLNIIKTDVTCNGYSDGAISVTVSGGTSPYSYYWQTGSTLPAISNLTAGIYLFTLTDNNNCLTTTNITVTEPAPLTLPVSITDVSCNGLSNGIATVNATGGTSPYSYSWSTGSSSATVSNLIAGTYSVTVTDNNNCIQSANAAINEPALLTGSITGVDPSCNGTSDGTATVSINGGTPPYQYNWSSGGSASSEINLNGGTYSVTSTDINGCTLSAGISLTEPSPIILSFGTTLANCNVADGSATVSVSGGAGGFSYLWSNGFTLSTASGLGKGTYTITVTDMDSCSNISAVYVGEVGGLDVTISSFDDVNCFNGNDGSATASGSFGTAPYTFVWSNGASGMNANSLSVGLYFVTITDNTGCRDTTSITILQPSQVSLTITTTGVNCFGGSDGTATVTGSGGTPPFSYLWFNGVTDGIVTGLSSGNYSVTATDFNGCTEASSTTITEPGSPLSASIFYITNVTCNGDSNGTATASSNGGTGPYFYLWNDPPPAQSTSTATGLKAGIWTVTITDSNGCTDTTSATLTEPSAISITITTLNASCSSCGDGTASVTPSGGTPPYEYFWDTGESGTSASGLYPGVTYTIVVWDANFCAIWDTFSVDYPVGNRDINEGGIYLTFYPNPVRNEINILFSIPEEIPFSLSMTDILGKKSAFLIKNETLQNCSYIYKYYLEYPGIYLIILKTPEGEIIRKCIRL